MADKLTELTSDDRANLKDISAYSLPANPSGKNLSEAEIKKRLYAPSLKLFDLLKNAISQTNAAFDLQTLKNTTLDSAIETNASNIASEIDRSKLAEANLQANIDKKQDIISTDGSITKSGAVIAINTSKENYWKATQHYEAVYVAELHVTGTIFHVNEEVVESLQHLIELAKGNSAALTSPVGFFANKYDGTNSGGIFFDSTGTGYIGDVTFDENGLPNISNCQPILTRDDASNLNDGDVLLWDKTNTKAVGTPKTINADLTLTGMTGTAKISIDNISKIATVYGLVTIGATATEAYMTIPSTITLAPINKATALAYVGDTAVMPMSVSDHTISLFGWEVSDVVEFNFSYKVQ